MVANSQASALQELHKLASNNRQSILISGPPGSGKSYLAQQYANILNIDNYLVVEPKVSDIREALDGCTTVDNNILLEISNLDLGVSAASYTLLKSLEEPMSNVYIVITCRNLDNIPDTIISRSVIVNLGPPTSSDIDAYGKEKDTLKFNNVCNRLVWKCVRSFSDADAVLNMTLDEISYYESLSELCKFNDTVSNLVWKLGHYDSNKECNLEIAIRSVMELMNKPFITRCGIDCIRDLQKGRIAQHAVLAKFIFNAKFCE